MNAEFSNFGYLQFLSLVLIPTILLIIAGILISRKNARRKALLQKEFLITERLVQAYITIAELYEDATKVNPADVREALHTIALLGSPETSNMARNIAAEAPSYDAALLEHLLRALRLSLREELSLP
jgi:hypothetical protein